MGEEIRVRVLFIPGLVRHLAKGWTEDQLISGRVHTLGAEEIVVELGRQSTWGDLARQVETQWGVAQEDQAYRLYGQTLSAKHTSQRLAQFGVVNSTTLLMSAGDPNPHKTEVRRVGDQAVMQRDATQVVTTTVEEAAKEIRKGELTTKARAAAEQPSAEQPTPFTGRSYQLSCSSKPETSTVQVPTKEGPSLEERRNRAIEAAMRRAQQGQQ